MNTVHVLDCTLRDGGYCNQWQFGFENTKKIISGLVESDVDIIECGFLTNKIEYNPDLTKFNTLEQISAVIPENRDGKLFVAMMNYGEYNIDDLPEYDGSSVDGIRVAFHKKNLKESLSLCKQIKAKGYKVFIQAMVSLCYSDKEFLEMIHMVNELEPYAFYIVDSFGMMKSKDLTRLFYVVEHNLKNNIWIGFHSHNNMQLAYSNAQTLVGLRTNRNLIIDSSIYGMGRGAGNLNTELFIEFLNDNFEKNYQLKPLLNIIDEILNDFYQRNYWGYSLPNYISAAHNAHPNYAGYLDDKKTLTVEDMNEIFDMMDDEKKFSYDKEYMEKLYLKYMAMGKVQEEHKEELTNALKGKKILLIAPGKSSAVEKDKVIKAASEKNTVVISVNFNYSYADVDYIFTSNLRRFKELDNINKQKCIVTSNISADEVYFQTKYKSLVSSDESVRDNAGLMAIKFLMGYDVEEIMLAGFDGYSHDDIDNYADKQMTFVTRNAVLDAMNKGMTSVLKEYSKQVKISFLTTAKHIII
ncbi:MAG: aldolase catalytic domain-containing protein [Oscillospiraceae bacterium]